MGTAEDIYRKARRSVIGAGDQVKAGAVEGEVAVLTVDQGSAAAGAVGVTAVVDGVIAVVAGLIIAGEVIKDLTK